MLKSCMDESALQFSEAKLDELTQALFDDADVDNSGTISFEELQAELDKHPGVIENLTIRWGGRDGWMEGGIERGMEGGRGGGRGEKEG